MATLRLAIVRRGLFGGGIEVSEQVTCRDDVDDVVLKDVTERDAGRERVVLGRAGGPQGNQPQCCGRVGNKAWQNLSGLGGPRGARGSAAMYAGPGLAVLSGPPGQVAGWGCNPGSRRSVHMD